MMMYGQVCLHMCSGNFNLMHNAIKKNWKKINKWNIRMREMMSIKACKFKKYCFVIARVCKWNLRKQPGITLVQLFLTFHFNKRKFYLHPCINISALFSMLYSWMPFLHFFDKFIVVTIIIIIIKAIIKLKKLVQNRQRNFGWNSVERIGFDLFWIVL